MEKNRLEAFSDGVLAIIITIMILELKQPVSDSMKDFLALGPTLLAYLISFLFISIYWVNHHLIFHDAARINTKILWCNIAWLFVMSFIPFATAWVGTYPTSFAPLAIYFADMFLAVDEARRKLGGETFFIGNMDVDLGLPRIRRYCTDILSEMDSKGIKLDCNLGGLDEYALLGEEFRKRIDEYSPDLLVVMGIPHALPGLTAEDILITDQPRELANLMSKGHIYTVGEISSHSMVMGTRNIVRLETADILREIIDG